MQSLDAPEMTVTETLLRVDRISRLGNKWIGRLELDQNIIEQLSESQIGLFAEGYVGLDTMFGRLLPIAHKSKATKTVVLYSSKEAGESIYKELVNDGHCKSRSKPKVQWQVGSMLFSSIEELARLKPDPGSIDSVILLDPMCMVYRARTMKTYYGRTHDRPQIVVNFLADQGTNGIRPVFMIMTTKRSAAVPTDSVARAFCLEGFWFLDGPSIACG